MKTKIWSYETPLGYLGSLSRVQIVEFFQNLMSLVLLGLEVTKSEKYFPPPKYYKVLSFHPLFTAACERLEQSRVLQVFH